MKKQILIGFLVFPVMMFAQIRKDQWLIGGNGIFTYSKSKELTFSSLQVSPAAGYFFIDKLAAGIRGSFTSDTYNWGTDKFRNSTITIAPFLRYYFLPLEQKVNLLADASFGYSWSKNKHFDPPGSFNYSFYNTAFMMGPAFFLNEHTALEVTIGYNYLSRGQTDSTITQRFQVGVGLQVHIGK